MDDHGSSVRFFKQQSPATLVVTSNYRPAVTFGGLPASQWPHQQGDKVEEVEGPPISTGQGDNRQRESSPPTHACAHTHARHARMRVTSAHKSLYLDYGSRPEF